ncbi:MAG TPA: hypothetical protein VJ350_05245 [Methanoregula sp.]|nr:hypothetical protein [Methanoregula sp.]
MHHIPWDADIDSSMMQVRETLIGEDRMAETAGRGNLFTGITLDPGPHGVTTDDYLTVSWYTFVPNLAIVRGMPIPQPAEARS